MACRFPLWFERKQVSSGHTVMDESQRLVGDFLQCSLGFIHPDWCEADFVDPHLTFCRLTQKELLLAAACIASRRKVCGSTQVSLAETRFVHMPKLLNELQPSLGERGVVRCGYNS